MAASANGLEFIVRTLRRLVTDDRDRERNATARTFLLTTVVRRYSRTPRDR